MNHNLPSWRRRATVAVAVVGAALPLAVSSAGAAPTPNAWQLDGHAGAEIVSGLEYYDRGALVVIPSGLGGPDVPGATTITGDDLPAPVDFIGRNMASGDVDGDGYADLVTSGRDYSGGGAGVMVLVVVPGGPQGSRPEDAYTVEADGAGIGGRVLAADLDRDGIADVVAQSGTPKDPEVTILWGVTGEELRVGDAFSISAPGQRRFGELMAAGSVDGDRQVELVLASGGRIPDNESSRRVRGYLNVCDVTKGRNVRCKAIRRVPAGTARMVVGDFIGGNAADVILGEPVTSSRDDDPNRPSLWLYRGTDHGITDAAPARLVRGQRGIPGRHRQWSGWGASLAAADIDRKGKDELVVGAASEGRGGRVTVLYGNRRGPGRSDRDVTISQATTGVPGANERFDGFGTGLSVLDVTGDGQLDLVVGVPNEDDRMGSIVIVPSGEGRLATRRSVRVEAEELGLDPERGEINLGWVLGQ